MVFSVVYRTTCQACGDQYRGETGRPPSIQGKEHLDGMTRSTITTPLGAHSRHSHEDCSFAVAVTILLWEPEIVARTTLEALRCAQHMNRIAKDSCEIAFCLPFTSDEVSWSVSASLREANLDDHVKVVEMPPANLKTRLVHNRLHDRLCIRPNCVICPFGKERDCMVSSAAYPITCQACGDQYIEETGPPLCIWVREHLDGMTRSTIHIYTSWCPSQT
ncbi:hypothetical protein Y032_0486g2336 [Ancylostoma ceylanicum]|uniref:Uncharacterized protein n=1 Tax=Ancylostoma ceylanicum TaxID=53326 RepID=A0A016WVE8_9BILA|nr:hypothetical protein Y032_0486g2336 [Ancylostoma ceylanicum]